MGMEFLFWAVILLLGFAVIDLTVGVSNDAVNFLNSSLGSRVAPRKVIMIIACLGILAGVTFSSGMMEVARKGIFNPQFFTMPELLTIFLAVMLTDIILLDLFNTFGLPTSTTVSIVFELLGAAVAVSLLKISALDNSLGSLAEYINTSKALMIIMGILLSVVIAFLFGAGVQFITRLVFTFDYEKRMKRYGAIWSGIAMASIAFFILVKGAKGASFISSETSTWIKDHGFLIMGGIFVVSTAIFFGLQRRGFNILKPVILVGTFALALAFAANDLVNFIGVPMAGLHSFQAASASDAPLTMTMDVLAKKVSTNTWLLLLAGAVMVATLWFSRKARTVTETEIRLGQQDEGDERFDSTALSRIVVRMAIGLGDLIKVFLPRAGRKLLAKRYDTSGYAANTNGDNRPSFDLLRASVNLMVASGVVSYATSQKLPLSTTYVTFMVAMGTSFADQAWGRESAVYRVTGVLTVIGGWFLTAFLAFTISGLFALVLFHGQVYGLIFLLFLAGFLVFHSHRKHRVREQKSKEQKIYNLKKITDQGSAVADTFAQMGVLVEEIKFSIERTLQALFSNNTYLLRGEKRKAKEILKWTNVISANVFKAMRLIQRQADRDTRNYACSVRCLQRLADGHRDLVGRAYEHTSNLHTGLLPAQVDELQGVGDSLSRILEATQVFLASRGPFDFTALDQKDRELQELAVELDRIQAGRIHDDTSKTRLSILYYAVVGNMSLFARQTRILLGICRDSFGDEVKG